MEENMQSTSPLPDESWDPPVIPVEHGSDAPTVPDESKIPEGKEPQVFDQSTGMNVPEPVSTYMRNQAVDANE